MTNQPTPRRMKANTQGTPYHQKEHQFLFTCKNLSCLPVVEPRKPCCHGTTEGECVWCKAADSGVFHNYPTTPPPAYAPCDYCDYCDNGKKLPAGDGCPRCLRSAPDGTPLERWRYDYNEECFFLDDGEPVERQLRLGVCGAAERLTTYSQDIAQLKQERDQLKTALAAARKELERISNDQPNGPTIARETLGKLKGTPMKTEHTKEPIPTVEWKAKAERLESILTCTEKPMPPGCARTRYALEEKLVKATDLLKLAVDGLEQAYVASEQHLGATPAKSWEVAANGVRKFREGIASLDARAALAANKEAR